MEDAGNRSSRPSSLEVPPTGAWGKGVSWPVLLALAITGFALRLHVSTYVFNFDIVSHAIVAGVMERGGNVYAATHRYNYGPIWFHLVHLFAELAAFFPSPPLAFRTLLSAFLSSVDLALFALLLRRFGAGAAVYFLFHPVSIIISGYHRQFEGLALLTGFLAALAFDRAGPRLDRYKWAGMAALATSLVIKHILFAFPFWLAVKERRLRRRLLVLFLPPAVFFASFLPYWAEGRQGIIQNVFLYRSFANAPLLNGWFPPVLVPLVPPFLFFLGALVVGAWLSRRLDATRSLLVYGAVLVACSPAIASQYLVIALPFVVVYRNPFTALYTLAASLDLLIREDSLHLAIYVERIPESWVGFQVQAGVLLAGVLWELLGSRIRTAARTSLAWTRDRVRSCLRDAEERPS